VRFNEVVDAIHYLGCSSSTSLPPTILLMCSFFQIVHRGPSGVRWRSILLQCPPVVTTYFSDVRQQQALLEDDIAVV